MNLSQIRSAIDQVARYLSDDLHGSADRILADTVWDFVRAPYQLDGTIQYLVHYTSIDALFSLLSCPLRPDDFFPLGFPNSHRVRNDDDSFLRIYDTYNSNDPNEGHFFTSHEESHDFQVKHSRLWSLLQDRASLPAYVASFRGVANPDDVDDLVFWRTYGHEGQGCALVFPVSFLNDYSSVAQVQYGCASVTSALDRMCTAFDFLSSSDTANQCVANTKSRVPTYTQSSLSPVPYLHKAGDYEFEQEVRVVVPFVDLPPGSLYCHRKQNNQYGLTLRHFARVPELRVRNILRTESFVVLGPSVRSRENLRFVLRERLRNRGLVGTTVCVSRIDYQS